jgi:hypothetical protein
LRPPAGSCADSNFPARHPGLSSLAAALSQRLGAVVAALAAAVTFAALSPAASWAAGAETEARTCAAGAISTTTSPTSTEGEPTEAPAQPSPEDPCWAEVSPYPFGSEGVPVTGPSLTCHEFFTQAAPPAPCRLTVASLAFRAWNRGLAATLPITNGAAETSKNPYGVWTFNGISWLPSPGFPGSSHCPGHTVLWAGKKDYWLIGDGPPWSGLCRFDGATLEWEELPLPAATLARVPLNPNSGQRESGGITAGACLAWNNCWFVGTYGTVVHWNGEVLADASPELAQAWLDGEYTAAVGLPELAGSPFAVAVSGTAESFESTEPLPGPEPEQAPAELDATGGGPFSPLPFTPPTSPQEGDPYRTDLVAVGLDSEGQGWVAGNPAGVRLSVFFNGLEERRPIAAAAPVPPSPLVPISTDGTSTSCDGPPVRRFTYGSPRYRNTVEPSGAFLWSSIGVFPGSGEALAGGRLLPRHGGSGSDPNEAPTGEPVIVRAACDGTTTVTRFRSPDPTHSPTSPTAVPADREEFDSATAEVNAIAVNATNDAWAATGPGQLQLPINEHTTRLEHTEQPPHLYRLTNGLAPEAAEGNDEEERPLPPEEKPIEIIEPAPPEAVRPPATITKIHKVHRKPAVYGVKASVHERGPHLTLYLTFKVRRETTLGAEALRHGKVVSKARPQRFRKGRTGVLVLQLDRKRWPTKVRFIS